MVATLANIVLPSGEAIWYADSLTPYSAATISSQEATTLADLMSRRERYSYEWANAGARGAEVGMRQGSLGYQVDTRTEYIYDSGGWRLSFGYVEANAVSLPTTTGTSRIVSGATPITFDTSASTDTTMVTTGGVSITFQRVGIYSVNLASKETGNNACTGQSQVVISTASTFAEVPGRLANGMFSGALMASAALPFFSVSSPGASLYFFFYNDSGADRTVASKITIGRMG